MRRVAIVVLAITTLLLPAVASAGAATDAALGLGAFAVFNQIIGGTGIFARSAPVVVASPPPVVVAPAPVVVAPPPVVYAQPVAVYPAPVYYQPYVQHYRPHGGWCPPGQAKKGRCGPYWR